MDQKKKQNIIIILCGVLIIILFSNIRIISKKVELLEQQLTTMSQNSAREYNNLYNTISQLNADMKEANLDVTDFKVSYNNLDYENGTVETNYTFRLNEIIPDGKYYLSYSPCGSRELCGYSSHTK